MHAARLITGHNLIQPSAPAASLEFTQDPTILAKCQSAVDDIRRRHAAESLSAELRTLEEAGFQFVEDRA